jgi:hypothetical protein
MPPEPQAGETRLRADHVVPGAGPQLRDTVAMLHERDVFMEIAHRVCIERSRKGIIDAPTDRVLGAAGQTGYTPTTADRSTALHVLTAPWWRPRRKSSPMA